MKSGCEGRGIVKNGWGFEGKKDVLGKNHCVSSTR